MGLPHLKEGYYESLYRLSIRDNAGLGGDRLHSLSEKTLIEIKEIKYLTVSIWGRTEAGWICMYMNGTMYVKKK